MKFKLNEETRTKVKITNNSHVLLIPGALTVFIDSLVFPYEEKQSTVHSITL